MAGLNRAYKRRGNAVALNRAPDMCLDAGSRISYPGTGTTWTDISGNGRNGILYYNTTFNSNNKGQFILDGTGDYIEITNCGEFKWQNINQISFDVVFKTTGSAQSRQYIFESRTSNGTPTYCWYLVIVDNNTNFIFSIGRSTSGNYTDWTHTPSQLTNKIWHICSTIDKTATTNNHNTYLNGSIIATRSFNFNTGDQGSDTVGTSLFLGNYFGSIGISDTQFHLNGSIYSSRVWKNKVLTSTEVATNFELLRGRYGI